MSKLILENISKTFVDKSGFRIKLYEDVNLSVGENEILSVIAPKGSGKSSLLKTAAGLESVDAGNVTSLSKTAYIPSSSSSFPWMNVIDNLKFAAPSVPEEKLKTIIKSVGLEGYETHFPDNGSLGFRLRISIARALAVEPQIIVMDEPFSQIDERYRIGLYELILQLKVEYKVTFFLATTNVTEALYLSDRIYLMSKHPGKIFDELRISFPNRERSVIFSGEFKNEREKIENLFADNSLNVISDFNI